MAIVQKKFRVASMARSGRHAVVWLFTGQRIMTATSTTVGNLHDIGTTTQNEVCISLPMQRWKATGSLNPQTTDFEHLYGVKPGVGEILPSNSLNCNET